MVGDVVEKSLRKMKDMYQGEVAVAWSFLDDDPERPSDREGREVRDLNRGRVSQWSVSLTKFRWLLLRFGVRERDGSGLRLRAIATFGRSGFVNRVQARLKGMAGGLRGGWVSARQGGGE